MPAIEEVRRVVTKYASEGAEKTVADLNAVAVAETNAAKAGETLAVVTDKSAKRQLSAANAVDRLRKTLDEEYRALQAVAKGQEILDRAVQQGTISQEEYAHTLDLLKTKYGVAQAANDNFGAAAQNSARLSAHEMQNLGFQLNDVGTMLASGSSPFQVMATQGGQVYQILAGSQGGVVGSLKQLGSGLLGLLTPVRVVTAGLLAMGVASVAAYSSWLDGQKKVEASLNFGQGRAIDLTVAQLNDLAEAAAKAGGVTVSTARVISGAFIETGRVSKENLSDLVKVTKDYAAATGQEIPEAAQELARAFADPIRVIDDLDERFNFLSAEVRQNARELISHNRISDAQTILLRELRDSVPDATLKLTANARAWAEVALWAGRAYTALGRGVSRLVDGAPIDDAYVADLRKQLEDAKKQKQSGSVFTPWDINTRIAELQAQLDDALRALEGQRRRADKALTDRTQKEADDAVRTLNPQITELERLTKLQAQLRAGLASQGNNADQYLMDLEGIKNQIDAITDGNGQLLAVSERLRRERELEIAVIRAKTPLERADAQAALDAYRAKAQGASNATAAAQAEDGKIRALAEVYAQLAQASRERAMAAEQALAQQQLEISLIGKTAEEAALLRSNFQTYWELRREAAQNGTRFDEAEYEALKKKNAEIAKGVQLTAELKLQSDIAFERSQLGRTPGDQAIASAQRSAGLPVDMNSASASAMRLNQTLQETGQLASSALSGFISDLRNGVPLVDALTNAMNKLLDKLLEMAMNQAIAGLLSGISGALGGGSVGGYGGNFVPTYGAAGPIAVPTVHTGGIVGEMPVARHDNPAAYVNAPRYHSGRDPFGLMAGEQRAIIKSDEGVFTAGQMKALGARMGAPKIAVNVVNQGGGQVEVGQPKMGANGEIQIDMMVRRAMRQEFVKDLEQIGPMSKALKGRFGLNDARGMTR